MDLRRRIVADFERARTPCRPDVYGSAGIPD
jgi:hypothetical protein